MHSISDPPAGPCAGSLLAAVGELLERPLVGLSDEESVELLRGVERAARMLCAVQHRLLIEVGERGIPTASVRRPTRDS